VAVAGGTWQAGLRHHGTTVAGTSAAYRDTFLVLAGFRLLAMLASWLRGENAPTPTTATPDDLLTNTTRADPGAARPEQP
jgi:hypothetical protein